MNHGVFVDQVAISILSKPANKEIRAKMCYFSPSQEIFSNTNTSFYGRPVHKTGQNIKL